MLQEQSERNVAVLRKSGKLLLGIENQDVRAENFLTR
jgi:hypothetical protein